MSTNKIMYESGFHLYGYKLENKIGDCYPVSSLFKDERDALRAFRILKKRGFDAIELRYLSPKFFEGDKPTK